MIPRKERRKEDKMVTLRVDNPEEGVHAGHTGHP